MNADQIRELVARSEGPALDFKRDQYDWSQDGNLELAKDLMAMANALQPGAEPAHILIGVEERSDRTGNVVGIALSSHLDDATMHEKVKLLLNRVPAFSYSAVDVDGLSVGVFEVRAGGRPFFALRDGGGRHKLRRLEARVRVGSSTDLASPDQIQAWAKEDDPSLAELRRLEIEERNARLVVRPFLDPVSITYREDPETLVLGLLIHNRGESRFTIASVRQTWTLTPNFYANWPELRAQPATPHSAATVDLAGAGVAPGASEYVEVTFDSAALLLYIVKEFGLACASSEWPLWVDGEVTVEAIGTLGRGGTHSRPVAANAIEAAFDTGRRLASEAIEEQTRQAARPVKAMPTLMAQEIRRQLAKNLVRRRR